MLIKNVFKKNHSDTSTLPITYNFVIGGDYF